MSERGPWSVKGIDQRARAVARDAARLEGITLGEYLNKLILEESRDDYPNEIRYGRSDDYGASSAASTLDQLTRRVEAVEARSTLAITGIDQSVMGLVARLEKTENGHQVIAGHVDGFIDELRDTHAALSEKVRQLEGDDSGERNLEALKSLEQALGKLAAHVYEEGGRSQEESDAIKGRVESGFLDLGERMEVVETRVEATLSDVAKRMEKAVEEAELRSEGTTRHLSERVTGLESTMADRMARVDRVEDDVSGALGSMESTLMRIQERLNRAESTTDAALKGLESTFDALDQRITAVSDVSGPEAAAKLRDEIETRFAGLADEMKAELAAAREEMAQQIAETVLAGEPEALGVLRAEVEGVKAKVSSSDAAAARAFETVGDQVSRITTSFDKRLRDVESGAVGGASEDVRAEIAALSDKVTEIDSREANAIDRVGNEVGKLADRLENRVAESEQASARAIEQIGDQVATVARRLQGRQDEAFGRLSAHVEETRSAQETRLSDALSSLSERFERIHEDASTQFSPVQKAIASLADRLEQLERSGPAVAGAPLAPDSDSREDDDLLAAFTAAAKSVAEEPPVVLPKAVGDDSFEPGLPEWDKPSETTSFAPSFDMPERPASDDDYTPSPASESPVSSSGHERQGAKSALYDPIAELANWDEDDDGSEARDSDVFDTAPDPIPEPAPGQGRLDDVPPVNLNLDEDMPRAAKALDLDTSPMPEPEPTPTADPDVGLEEDLDAADYITRARRAAIAANEAREGNALISGDRVGSRTRLYAAAGIAVVAAAGAGGFLYLRGKQAPPTNIAAPAQPVTSAEAGAGASAGLAAAAAAIEADASEAAEPEGIRVSGTAPRAQLDPLPEPTQVAAVETARVPEPTPTPAPTPAPEPRQNASFPAIPAAVSLAGAAEGGDRIAQYQLGVQKIEASDYVAAADLIRQSAQQGLPVAQYRLAKLHEKGLGVPRDLAAARTWTERAARGGNTRAMHDLAVFYADGEGGAQSYASAAEWFGKASEFGVLDSQYNLGVLYQQGLGLTANPVESLFWFSVAAKNGDTGAPSKVTELVGQVSEADAEAVRRRVAGWRAASAVPMANGAFDNQPWQGGGVARTRGVQVALNALGYSVGRPDGVNGPATARAIRAYQRAEGLTVDGTISNALVTSLNTKSRTARNAS